MTDKEKFNGFDFSRNPYEQEAEARWGKKAVRRTKGNFHADMQEEMNQIYSKLANLRNKEAGSAEAQAAVGEWFDLLNRMGSYSLEAFAELGEMYVEDERFMKNIDQFGEGLAVFMRSAMKMYAARHK